jgi:hypothetical protein
VRPVREGVKESEFAYYGSGFVQAVLKSESLEVKFFGILSVRLSLHPWHPLADHAAAAAPPPCVLPMHRIWYSPKRELCEQRCRKTTNRSTR